MNLWLNFGFAWISIILVIFLSVIFILPIAARRSSKYKNFFMKLNRNMRKHHKKVGIALVAAGLVHGLYSSEAVLSFNIGTISWIISILLGVNWMMRKYLAHFRGWMYYHRVLTIVFLSMTLWHIIDVGGIQVNKVLFNSPDPVSYQYSVNEGIKDSTSLEQLNAQFEGAELKDGVYTGEATGYRPGLKVSVKIENNSIINVEVTDHNEVNQRFYSIPIKLIPPAIVQNQTLDVDMVSGATFTSVGIINAVNDALSKAFISGELPQVKELPTTSRKGRR
ncbi:MAG TPA: FMN-binding protein [Ruminiclostridium sp.]